MKLLLLLFCLPIFLSGNTQNILQENEMLKWLQGNNVKALSIGVMKNGSLQKAKVYGKTCENNVVPDSNLFNVASLTKPIVAVLTLKLVNVCLWSFAIIVSN